MEKISDQLGIRIRQYRLQRNLTKEALALSSGLNVSFLGDVERGIKKPSIETLEKLLDAMCLTFQEFFNFETEIKPFKECLALERLNMGLHGRPEDEVEMVYNIVQQVLNYNDNKK